jgi:hypothetical protein
MSLFSGTLSRSLIVAQAKARLRIFNALNVKMEALE